MEIDGNTDRRAASRHCAGFTLIELLFVVGLIAVMTAISVPTIQTAVAHARLRGAASNLHGLMQTSRMRAVKLNQTMTIRFQMEGPVPLAFVKSVADLDADLTAVDLQVELGKSTFRMAVPTGDPPPLTEATLSYAPLDFPAVISFNARGLPCQYVSGVCTTAGFVYYVTDVSQPNAWTAVSVSPGGRVKQWFWNGKVWVD